MKMSLVSVCTLALCSAAAAQTISPAPSDTEARAPRPARARGIATALAEQADQVAIATCLTQGLKVTALVTDSAGVPIAMISGDGAAEITQRIASGKARTVIAMKMSSGDVVTKAKTDKSIMDAQMADPSRGSPRQGGLPILIGADLVGAIAVSGSPTGAQDEVCAKAGLDAVAAKLQ
jgi:uncharacterized protein GlcG (DUF336 family)